LTLTSYLPLTQGELEHRRSKARYKRTDKKTFVKQLARMERRESRLRRIRERFSSDSEGRFAHELVPRTPQEHHHIGVSEKHHENIGCFLRKRAGDPAVQVQIIARHDRALSTNCPPYRTFCPN
jgi:sRNA-binding protein